MVLVVAVYLPNKIKINGKAQEKNSEKHRPKDHLYNTNISSYKYVWKGAPKKPLGRRLVRNHKCKDFLLTLPVFATKYSSSNYACFNVYWFCCKLLFWGIFPFIFLLVPAVSSVAKRTLSMREVWGSIPGPVKSSQCRQRLATVATFLRSCTAQALSRGDGSTTRYTLRRNTVSMMKI